MRELSQRQTYLQELFDTVVTEFIILPRCNTSGYPIHGSSLNSPVKVNSSEFPELAKFDPDKRKVSVDGRKVAVMMATIITATFLPSNKEAPSPHRRQDPRTIKLFRGGGLIHNSVSKDTQRIKV
ncbi:hypothetical protein TNCV_2200041 [Trichonephila clavipes]|nr:hypothetical protein TNCV_2200041 [Trichonephila clavipes]